MLIIVAFIGFVVGQITTYEETVSIAPGGHLQLASMAAPDDEYDFNPGHMSSSLTFTIISPIPQSNYSMLIFPFANDSYTCAMSSLLKSEDPSGCMEQMQQCDDARTTQYDLSTFIRSQMIQTCGLQSIMKLQLFNQTLNDEEQSRYIIVLQNVGENALVMQLNYEVTVSPSDRFYELTLGLCISLGILVILLTSILCIFNFKYQKVKESNITFNLVRGESSYRKLDNNKNK